MNTIQVIYHEDIPIDGAIHIYSTSMSGMMNSFKPELVLQNKDNTVCFHTVCQFVVIGESLIANIDENGKM